MKKYSKEDVLRQYEESGRIMYQATLDGDYKANNREGKRLTKIFKYFEENREFAFDCIHDMLSSQNVVVRTDAAAYCLALNENIDEALEVLSEISDRKENGIFGFNAKKTLEVWNAQGYLQIYPKKEK
ncbi:MAG: hypothetical protein IJ282_02515 [Lachnospiraceae bacterium]|nr:hypothetical protein [Lachnospiraceae bacterium]